MNACKITEVRVYWDAQDSDNEGWAVEWHEHNQIRGSESIEADTLNEAIEESILTLGLPCRADDFGIADEEGGFAIWTSDFLDDSQCN